MSDYAFASKLASTGTDWSAAITYLRFFPPPSNDPINPRTNCLPN